MKRVFKFFLLFILCSSLLFQGYPASAAGGSSSDKPKESESASSQPSKDPNKNEPTYNTKYTVKKIKKPPYCITVNGNEYEDFSTQPWTAGADTEINIVGQRDEDGIAGEWQFFVTFKLVIEGDAVIEEVPGSLQMGIVANLNGSAKGNLVDLGEQKKKEKEEKKNEWQDVFPSEKPSDAPTPTPIHTDADTIRNSQEAPKELYKGEFDVDLAGTIENLGQSTVFGELGDESQWYKVDADFLPDDTNIKSKAKVKIMVDSNNNVVAYLEGEGKTYGPYAGAFTCEEDLDIQRKDSGTWPIWGVWTDVNPYEPMPNVEKDLTTIAEKIKEGKEPKKINYPEGRWVVMKQGKKGDPTTYSTVIVSSEDITFETGEIWPYPGSAMFKPESSTVYAKDLLSVIKKNNVMDYEMVITYHTANDTITYPRFGNLVRVRDANLLGVWSSKGNLEMPVPGHTDVPPGTWYEFVRGGEDTESKTVKGYSAAYTFTRITANSDKTMVIDTGTAVILPVADDERINLTDIKSQKVASDGTKSDPKDKDNEILEVKDFDKGAGTVKLGSNEYTLIPGLKIEGSWATLDPAVGPPDVENGAFLPRDKNGDSFEAPAGSQWIEFNKGQKTFKLTQMIENPGGILVSEGSYRTFGEDLLLLSDIKGSFYAKPGTDAQGFTGKTDMFGERLFQVEQKTDEDKNPVSLEIAGMAKFNPIEEEEDQDKK